MADAARTVLISGCSSGIGLELAVQLARDPGQRYQGKGTRLRLGRTRMGMASQDPQLFQHYFHWSMTSTAFVGLGRTQDTRRPPSHLCL